MECLWGDRCISNDAFQRDLTYYKQHFRSKASLELSRALASLSRSEASDHRFLENANRAQSTHGTQSLGAQR